MADTRSVVYFAYLGDEGEADDMVHRRIGFMESQLRWLADLAGASTHPLEVLVAYVAPRRWDGVVHDAVTRHGFALDAESVRAERRNSFELPGFRAMKALAQRSAPERLIYYCHSKGIVQLSQGKMGMFRLHAEVGLTADLTALAADPGLTRAGLFPSRFGWCWYNFFWVKAGYMAALPVEESADRYSFEALLGDRSDRHAYRFVLPLIDRLPADWTGVALQPWYRPEETSTPALEATYARYAGLAAPGVTPAPAARGASCPG